MENAFFTVRPMAPDDIPAASALWRVTEGMGLGESDRPDRLARFLARNPGLSAVAVEGNGTLIGAVLCGDDGRRGYLHHLAVRRERRRLGVARALLAHCFAGLARNDIERCNIFLLTSNVEGEKFWIREGWKVRDNLKVLQRSVAPETGGGCGCSC